MATFNIQPKIPTDLVWPAHTRNGMVPNGAFVRYMATALNYVPAYLRKVPLTFCQDLGSIKGSAAGTKNYWRARFRTGYGTTKLRAVFLMAHVDNALATDSRVNMSIIDVDDVSTADSALRLNWIDTTAADIPNEYIWGTAEATVIAGNRLSLLIEAIDYARPLACMLYEVGTNPVDTDITATADQRIGVGGHILDSTQSNLLTTGTLLWKQNAANVLNWTSLSADDVVSHTGTTYTNILDGSSTTVTSSTPGYHITEIYHNSASATTVPVEIAVYAQRTAGAGTTSNNKVRLTDGTNHLEVTGITSTPGWFIATGTLPASANMKLDLQVASDAVDTLAIHAVSVYEWEA